MNASPEYYGSADDLAASARSLFASLASLTDGLGCEGACSKSIATDVTWTLALACDGDAAAADDTAYAVLVSENGDTFGDVKACVGMCRDCNPTSLAVVFAGNSAHGPTPREVIA